MQRLEVSGAVRPIYGSLGVKRLRVKIVHLVDRSELFKLVAWFMMEESGFIPWK